MAKMEFDDVLAHYGVLGMKWGVRKRNSDSPEDNGPNRKERRALKRKTKSAALRRQADEQQRIIDSLQSKGPKSPFMLQKYGAAMGIDTRAADIRIGLLNGGHTKKQLVRAEIKSAEESKRHFLSDAQAVAAGKLTSKTKMLIGAGIVIAAITAAVAALAVVGVKAEAAEKLRLDKITAGQKVTSEDWWKKLINTEKSRVSGIAKDAFDKMPETPITVPPGNVFHRISTDEEKEVRERIYAAVKDEDVDRYKASLPRFWKQWGLDAESGYDVSLKNNVELKSPGEKVRIQKFIDLLGQKPSEDTFNEEKMNVEMQRWMGKPNAETRVLNTIRDTIKSKPGDQKLSNEEFGLKYYRDFALGLAQENSTNKAYFNSIKEAGYNALIDDNDAGKLSDSPFMIFDANKNMERMGAKVLSKEDIEEAKKRIVELANRG